MLPAIVLAAAAAAGVACTSPAPLAELPKGYSALSQSQLAELLVGKAMWDEAMAPPNVYDHNFVIAFGPDGRILTDGADIQIRGTYRFTGKEVCLTNYIDKGCFRIFRDHGGALLRSVGAEKGEVYMPVYTMRDIHTLPLNRPALVSRCPQN